MSNLIAYVDGGSRGNPGPSGIGVVIDGSAMGPIRIAKWIGYQDNNVAEYAALLEALQCALNLKASTLHVYSDSEVIVRQMRGEYICRSTRLYSLQWICRKLAGSLQFSISHIPRQHNSEANRLANSATRRISLDFVVMCESVERAAQAHEFARDALKTLNADIHALDAPDSKSRIGTYSKDGLLFLGIRFEGSEIFPASKVVKRFENKVKEVLNPTSGDSLFKTLQKLTNLINGWGKCYRKMRVVEAYLRLDTFITAEVETYLEKQGVRLVGKNKRRHMRFLGIPSLTAMVEYKKKAAAVAVGGLQCQKQIADSGESRLFPLSPMFIL
jgi:ribonuclease HI